MDEMRRKTIEERVARDFARLEAELAARYPGILDVMRVYGDWESAVRQADEYFAAMERSFPLSNTSNTSG